MPDNQVATLRKAGYGAWWADGHPTNISMALPGHVQTNNRAELAAVLHVLQVEPRKLLIKTDSDYVLKGCLHHRHVWATAGWAGLMNADLWRQVHSHLESRNTVVVFSKVKGHATPEDVAGGLVSARDKHGNDAADALAGKGARSHASSGEHVRYVMHRRSVTKAVQLMMLDILSARMQACSQQVYNSTASSAIHIQTAHQQHLLEVLRVRVRIIPVTLAVACSL
jgi:ribonuclease HI